MILSSHGIIGSQILQATGLLIEYPGAAAAYSLRLLRSTYTGSAIRVRIDTTGQPEYNIGFVDGELDVATLEGYCTGGLNAFVKTWYDQSGNGRDATQATAANQPQIVSSGSVLTLTGTGSARPCLKLDGVNDCFDLSITIPISTGDKFSIYQLDKKASASSKGIWITGGPTSSDSPFGPIHYGSVLYMNTKFNASTSGYKYGASLSTNYNLISGYMKDSDTTSEVYVNNALYPLTSTTGEPRSNAFSRIGARVSEYSQTSTQEMIIYLNDQSTNNTAINNNINDYYGIY